MFAGILKDIANNTLFHNSLVEKTSHCITIVFDYCFFLFTTSMVKHIFMVLVSCKFYINVFHLLSGYLVILFHQTFSFDIIK